MERDHLDRDIQIDRCAQFTGSNPHERPANPAFTMSKISGVADVRRPPMVCHCQIFRRFLRALSFVRLVEPIGIEPTTSSLQSSRSPN
jgi:hypothetical protein